MASGIHRLVRASNVSGLRVLLGDLKDAKAAVNEVDDDTGTTPLYDALACVKPNLELVELLLQAGADPGFVKVTEYPRLPKGIGEAASALFGGKMPSNTHREPLLSAAINHGDVELLRLLAANGADYSYSEPNGYPAMVNAVYGPGDRLPVVEYLLGLGIPVNVVTSYGEIPILVSSRFGHFKVVAGLMAAGADESILGWNALMRAIAIGSDEDLELTLRSDWDLSTRDACGRTALHLAIMKGDLKRLSLLLSKGASLSDSGAHGETCLSFAIKSGDVEMVEWLVAKGCPLEERNDFGDTPLADAAERDDLGMVDSLLRLGADPNAPLGNGTILDNASDRQVILRLLESGADPAGLEYRQVHILLGLQDESDDLDGVTKEEYLADRYPREGSSNPEEITGPYKLAMIRSGVNAYRARTHFDDPWSSACNIGGRAANPVWCAARFGQSFTMLPDGRTVLIAGEHEDGYDPDFCIYNDVFCFQPDGRIQIHGYPYSVFPPTDFHTATLVGPNIYIIGSLGYSGTRSGPIPVYRLSTVDFRIEGIAVFGEVPPRIYKHRAVLSPDGSAIRISGGKAISSVRGKEKHDPNQCAYELDLRSVTWSEVTP